ncbi:hypothetical protein BX616_009014 [Lobosporangium transversale]|uniref:BZIP domain-containing protein n=1 Tax=Lobosporangium transversale TaxID=64571 RepID=A0A1Y2GVP7_9FUNG|nr:hypothetical protein BCR41DRAFT_349675 [Lobosporangium transversale]KAF9914080.1 hypothetical protein BX616_009014 [Lobosporangium transversale]ORZ22784.1 hypothetical protein BCR41DRAFT_349675 [Lobosporangium transversale]|eukprot:XP_021883338.1 hypothetical protein BCR41DRAFT_349675 [Lobosporangium transversale]
MNNAHFSRDLSYSEDDDDLVFQDRDDDMDMAYSQSMDHHSMGLHYNNTIGTSSPNANYLTPYNYADGNNHIHHINNNNSNSIHSSGQSTYANHSTNLNNNVSINDHSNNIINGVLHNNTIGNHATTITNQYDSNNNIDSNSNEYSNNNTNPPEKIRKKPGRKPGPTCPALRKEQNRAAQRAFRDRKERHLHQLENMIKDLKNQHFLVTSAYQREIRQLKAAIESLQSENYYLREVVFAFESALSKSNHLDILKDVKQELFRRHYENRAANAAAKSALNASPVPVTPATPGTPITPATPVTPATGPTTPPAALVASSDIPKSTAPATPHSPAGTMSPGVAAAAVSSPHHASSSSSYAVTAPAPITSISDVNNNDNMDTSEDHGAGQNQSQIHTAEEGILSLDGDILYKAPPLFISEISGDGKAGVPSSLYVPLSVPRPTYRPPGTTLPKHTDYTKHPTVFDELQSSLFPPGTLESFHISMATPQEVVSDDSLFADPTQTGDGTSTSQSIGHDKDGSESPLVNVKELDDGSDDEQFFHWVSSTLGIKKEVAREHRLRKEFRILAQAKPQENPNIDPHIYELPHDPRIDFIPCAKLRAQMIVHQHRYDPDELFQLLIDGAICHGPPLHKDSWQLPEAFFERFGFLLGLELERIRNKKWPPKKD